MCSIPSHLEISFHRTPSCEREVRFSHEDWDQSERDNHASPPRIAAEGLTNYEKSVYTQAMS